MTAYTVNTYGDYFTITGNGKRIQPGDVVTVGKSKNRWDVDAAFASGHARLHRQTAGRVIYRQFPMDELTVVEQFMSDEELEDAAARVRLRDLKPGDRYILAEGEEEVWTVVGEDVDRVRVRRADGTERRENQWLRILKVAEDAPVATDADLYESGWEHVEGDEWHATGASGRLYRLHVTPGETVAYSNGDKLTTVASPADAVKTIELIEGNERYVRAQLAAAEEPAEAAPEAPVETVTYTVEEVEGRHTLTEYRFSDGQHWRIVRHSNGRLVAVWKKLPGDAKATRTTLGSLDAALATAARVEAPAEAAEEPSYDLAIVALETKASEYRVAAEKNEDKANEPGLAPERAEHYRDRAASYREAVTELAAAIALLKGV